MGCIGDVETKSVHVSSAIDTNLVSSSSYSLMRLHRIVSVDTVKTSMPHA